MKKFLSLIFSAIMVITLSVPVLASEAPCASLHDVSEAFGIPLDVLTSLDSQTLTSLIKDATNNRLVSSNDTYVKLVFEQNGDITMHHSTYAEYLKETRSRADRTDESSGWMRFHTSVFEVDSITGQASCAFTWLTPPSPRSRDVVGISLRNGTIKTYTANGFYNHTSPNDNYSHTFTDKEIRETGGGVTANFNLRLSDYTNGTRDYMFLRTNFTKDGRAEGVNGAYAHQKYSFSFNPVYEISRQGKISISGGLNITSYYVQDTSYIDIVW